MFSSIKSTLFAYYMIFFGIFNAVQTQAEKPMWVTIYVHGTMTKLGLNLVSKFYPEICYGSPGLHHVDKMPQQALFRRDVDLLCAGDSNRFCKDHFYTFRWSGALSFSEREIAGKQLYGEVTKLLQKYHEKYGFYPKIRIMTFSHGGNVALNMASHLPFFKKEPVHLELLIVACPVQKVTEKFIEHPAINSIYMIYSSRDLLQVVDNYKFENKRYFPKRFFETNRNNCHQIKVFINNRGLGHLDLLRSFMVHLPDTLNKADSFALGQNFSTAKDIKFGKEGGKIIEISIKDDEFCFYKGYNLIPCVYGKRKNKPVKR